MYVAYAPMYELIVPVVVAKAKPRLPLVVTVALRLPKVTNMPASTIPEAKLTIPIPLVPDEPDDPEVPEVPEVPGKPLLIVSITAR